VTFHPLDFAIVDSHQHFVDVDRFQYYWMGGVPNALHRSYLPRQLAEELGRAGVSFTVAVQAHPSTAESLRLVELCAEFPFIRGVVASVDLTDPGLEGTLQRYRESPAIRAVRHQQAEDGDARWFLDPRVLRGFEAVERSGLVYDFLCRAHQLPCTSAIARTFPGLRLVLEHAGKPHIGTRGFAEWAAALEPLHSTPNVCCKLSELTTQAEWSSWTPADLRPYISHVMQVFGYQRVMWGSGWPICLLASSYQQTIDVTLDALPGATQTELALVFRDNAIAWYGLDLSTTGRGCDELPAEDRS
jgi:L-fuconolactonase